MANVYDEIVKKAAKRQGSTNSGSKVTNINSNREAAKAKLAEYIANPTDFDAIDDYKYLTTPQLTSKVSNNALPNIPDGRINVDIKTPLELGNVAPKGSPMLADKYVDPNAYDLAVSQAKAKVQADKDAELAAKIAKLYAAEALRQKQETDKAIQGFRQDAPIPSFVDNKKVLKYNRFVAESKKIDESNLYNRTYLETLNNKRKEAGLSSLGDKELQDYISMIMM